MNNKKSAYDQFVLFSDALGEFVQAVVEALRINQLLDWIERKLGGNKMKLRHRIGLWLFGDIIVKVNLQIEHAYKKGYIEGKNYGLEHYAIPTDEDQRRFDEATAKAKADGTSLYQDNDYEYQYPKEKMLGDLQEALKEYAKLLRLCRKNGISVNVIDSLPTKMNYYGVESKYLYEDVEE